MPTDMKKSENIFSPKNQLNARRNGGYEKLAAKAEMQKCVFCDLREKYIVTEKEGMVLTVNIFPYINGHLLIIPRRHVESFMDLSDEEILTANHLMKSGMKLLKTKLEIGNYWMIIREGKSAQKTVKHLHWQVLPYIDGLNVWNHQEITIPSIELAERLRKGLLK